ncbi:hypothetical protein N7468_002202 [Penicillium chermesinum]|uniref:Short chain dehydrogenase n=1 Tax=Penicillium chermesinum TaxID=63820 RepID=A0A9W9PI24_9EURO|nr:uncharacterized protein N7468_002202 [Penicillium chermesinum]KAJ5247219.1 hypothetical protein N7468_002202 [Penicillium chermesinum]KAJ6145463.1 hypothetical protein N7470_009358 [Penicillium chermesinum]
MASKIVLITGANSGVGFATSKFFSSQPGYHVIMACRDAQKGKKALSEIQSAGEVKGSLSLLELDVDSDESIRTAFEAVKKEFGKVDVLLSNAGVIALGSEGREKLTRIFQTNVAGAFLFAEAFTPLLLKSSKPYLIQVSSSLGSLAWSSDPNNPYYHSAWDEYRMSKAALNLGTIQQHKRLHSQNVKVFAFCPGLVRSNLRGEAEEAVSAGGNAGDPLDSAKALFDIAEGKRDADAGKFVNGAGVIPW